MLEWFSEKLERGVVQAEDVDMRGLARVAKELLEDDGFKKDSHLDYIWNKGTLGLRRCVQ